MPLTGTLDLSPLTRDVPLVERLDTGAWDLPRAEVLQILFELEEANMTALLPRALHPTIPPTISFVFTRVPDSMVGPFTLAEARVGCRSGARPRAFLVRAFCDSDAAIAELRRRWGYPVERADVRLRHHYDRVFATVESGGRVILDCGLMNPEAIGGGDIQYLPNMNLCRVRKGGAGVVRLIQVDADYAVHRAERGRPLLSAFEGAAWGLTGATPDWPVSASYTVSDITMPQIRYMVDPMKPPLESVETVY